MIAMAVKGKHPLFDQLLDAKLREPFVPFAIVLHDGKRYEVHDRWHFAVSEGSSWVVALRDDQTHAILPWSDVAAVKLLEPAGS